MFWSFSHFQGVLVPTSFIWMQLQLFVKNSSQAFIGKAKSSRVFLLAKGVSWRRLNWSSYSCHIFRIVAVWSSQVEFHFRALKSETNQNCVSGGHEMMSTQIRGGQDALCVSYRFVLNRISAMKVRCSSVQFTRATKNKMTLYVHFGNKNL